MGLCFGCTAASTLLDETFFCPKTTPEGLCDYISQADGKDNWVDIVPDSRTIGRTGQGTREITHTQGKDWFLRYARAGKDLAAGTTVRCTNCTVNNQVVSYTILLGSNAAAPMAIFDVSWSFFPRDAYVADKDAVRGAEGSNVRWYADKKTFLEEEQQGGEASGAFTRRVITNFKAHQSLHLPWTVGLRNACRQENQNIVDNHLQNITSPPQQQT